MGKKTRTREKLNPDGRGVWESNPPGTAPSDPPAVLKTVRPTAAPTPPCMRGCILPFRGILVKHGMCVAQVAARAQHPPVLDLLPSTQLCVNLAGLGYRQLQYSAFWRRVLPP